MASYEFFKKEFEFKGKHARMVSELWYTNDYEHTYFKRLIDVYIIASVIGFRTDHKAEEDDAPIEPKSIFPEQMLNAKDKLDFLLQIMIILDNKDNMSKEECVKKAFKGAETKEEFDQYQNMFNSYVRGGVEELYQMLVVRKNDMENERYDEKTSNLMEMIESFATSYSVGN